MRPLLIVAALAAAVVLFALRLAPASLADSRVASLTRGAVHLTDVDGTLWNAHGVLAAGATQVPIAWRLDAWPLLRGELSLHLVRDDLGPGPMPRGNIAVRRNGVELRDVDATVPAAFIAAAAGSSASLAGGNVELNAASVEWAPPANRGELRLRWSGAWVMAPGGAEPTALGEITVMLSAAADAFSGPVSNAGGSLALHGNLTLGAQGGVRLSLLLKPRDAEDRELARSLSMIGVHDGDGWRVEWRTPPR